MIRTIKETKWGKIVAQTGYHVMDKATGKRQAVHSRRSDAIKHLERISLIGKEMEKKGGKGK